MINRKNLILIGMPGAGKSTVGVLLAKHLGVAFMDTDILMQTGEGCRLQKIIAAHGIKGFQRIEERYLLSLPPDCGVVATGGSAVYSGKAMAHLRTLGPAVYLKIGLALLEHRLGNLAERGVLHLPGQTIGSLYDQRCPLYEHFADITVSTAGVTPDQVVTAILRQL